MIQRQFGGRYCWNQFSLKDELKRFASCGGKDLTSILLIYTL